jgi:hypothetical protein
MRKLILSAGVAAMAIAAPAAAKPGHGGGHGGGHAQVQRASGGQAKAQRAGGQQRVANIQRPHGGSQHAERHDGSQQRVASIQRQRGNAHAQRVERKGGERLAERGHGNARNRQVARVDNRAHGNRDIRVANKGDRDFHTENRRNRELRVSDRGGREVRIAMSGKRSFAEPIRVRAFNDDRAFRTRDDFRRVEHWRDWNDGDWDRAYGYRGIPAAYVGCPPGLAKKSPSCVPPGLARSQFVGQVLPTGYSSNYFPQSLRYLYADTPDYYYRWGDGYAYRVNRQSNLISALLPLIGAGYGIGQPFPYMSDPYYNVPNYYQSFYPNYGNGGDYYRYANGYVYEIDSGSGYIEDVIPLLDRGYGVGQMMPASYSYYNVPYQYRSLYYDTPDYSYRYAPGAIYQVDRDTQLITSVASLLTGGLAVGQALPASYSVYNVPYEYRTTYYDRPDAWYRYSDGYIYQVDPTTQLITAIVRSIV